MERARLPEPQLTDRQREVLELVSRGHTNSEIAEMLGISLAGAKWHVSELLSRFCVDSREELIALHEQERSVPAKVRRFWLALGSLGGLKPAIVLVAVSSCSVAAIVAGGLVLSIRNGEASDHTAVAEIATSTATVATATPDLSSHPGGSQMTLGEAIDHARSISEGNDVRASLLQSVPKAIAGSQFQVASVNFLPSVSHYDAPDADRYWDDLSGTAPGIWAFQLAIPAVDYANGDARGTGTLQIELIFADRTPPGPAAQLPDPLAYDLSVLDPATGELRGGGGGGFFSRRREELMRQARDPTGPAIWVAWLNGTPGSASLWVYPTRMGACTEHRTSAGEQEGAGCGGNLTVPDGAPNIAQAATLRPSGELTSQTLDIRVSPETARIVLLFPDGTTRTVAPSKPADPVLGGLGFAYLEVQPPGAVTVITYDQGGTQLSRTVVSPLGPPPPHP